MSVLSPYLSAHEYLAARLLCLYWITATAAAIIRLRWKWLDRMSRYGRMQSLGALSRGVGFSIFYVVGMLCGALLYNFNSITDFAWMVHCFVRFLECLLVHQFSGTMSIIGFFSGVSFYIAVPASFAFASITHDSPEEGHWLTARTAYDIFSIGIAIFLRCRCHAVLRRHQEQQAKRLWVDPARTHRLHPEGSVLFQWVLCPHYSMEILMYYGIFWAFPHVEASSSVHVLLASFPVVFSFANLFVSSIHHRQWLSAQAPPGQVLPKWNLFPGL